MLVPTVALCRYKGWSFCEAEVDVRCEVSVGGSVTGWTRAPDEKNLAVWVNRCLPALPKRQVLVG
jgi:hypothetical protein